MDCLFLWWTIAALSVSYSSEINTCFLISPRGRLAIKNSGNTK